MNGRVWIDGRLRERRAVMGRVLRLVGFAFLLTAGGVLVGGALGPDVFPFAAVGSFATLIALLCLKARSPLNLGLVYAFATCEGIAFGPLLDIYLAKGLAGGVLQATAATAAVTLATGTYGASTKRDLMGLAGLLGTGLLGLIAAWVAAIFLGSSWLVSAISAVSTAVFTGYIVYDLNRVAKARDVRDGEEVLLAVNVYLDILNLFLNLFRLFGRARSDDHSGTECERSVASSGGNLGVGGHSGPSSCGKPFGRTAMKTQGRCVDGHEQARTGL